MPSVTDYWQVSMNGHDIVLFGEMCEHLFMALSKRHSAPYIGYQNIVHITSAHVEGAGKTDMSE